MFLQGRTCTTTRIFLFTQFRKLKVQGEKKSIVNLILYLKTLQRSEKTATVPWQSMDSLSHCPAAVQMDMLPFPTL